MRMNHLKPLLSMVFPVHNEVSTIENVLLAYYKRIASKIPLEIIVAEDGSTDGTRQVLLSLRNRIPIKLCLGNGRKGYAKAVGDALKHANGDWIFFSDSDGQYRSLDFWTLWKKREDYDMVIGWKVRRTESPYRIFLQKGFHAIVKSLFGVGMHDIDCGFRLMRNEVVRKVIDEVNHLEYSFWAEFTIHAFSKGFRIGEAPISHNKRAHGSTHIYGMTKIPWIVLKEVIGLRNLRSRSDGSTLRQPR